MRTATLLTSTLLTLASAFTQPKGNPSWGAILLPDLTHSVIQGQKFNITWDPNYGNTTRPVDGVKVSLVLCHGNSNNCALNATAIAENVSAGDNHYEWQVPCDLAVGQASTDTGYGMLIIVQGTGEYQYSTQYSVLADSSCQC